MAEQRKKMPRPLAVADILSATFNGKPAGKRLDEGKIWLAWDTAVGDQIAAKARPVSFRDGVLTVAVASAPWMQQLAFLKIGMIERLNEHIGSELVRDIYLKAGRAEAPPPAPKPRRHQARQLSREEEELIAAQTGAIEDDELRAEFARLLSRHLTER